MAERRDVKRDFSFVSLETPLGTNRLLKRDCGDDHPFQIMHYINGLLINEPGVMVAAVGGIPEELKIKDGISYSFPCPTFKVPKYLPQDPIQRHWTLLGALHESLIESDFQNAANRAYAKALGTTCKQSEEGEGHLHNTNNIPTPTMLQAICKQLEEGEGLHNINQLPPSMIEVNVAAPPPPPPPPPPVHPIPTSKQVAPREENKSVKNNIYSIRTTETPHGTRQVLRRDCDDGTIEVLYLKAILANKPGVVLAVGGIPDELKIKGGISFSFPCPSFKFPKKMPKDPTENEKVMYKIHKEALVKYDCRKAFIKAYKKALGISSSSISEQSEEEEKEKAFNLDQEPRTVIEVNLAKPLPRVD